MNKSKLSQLLSAAGMLLVLEASPVFAAGNSYWDFSIYGTTDPQKLLQFSIDSESKAEKLRIRSYLASKFPDIQEGLFSRAWVAGYEGKSEESKGLYVECTQRYPRFTTCLNNVVADNPDDFVLRQRYLEIAPEVFNYSSLRTYIDYLERKGKKDELKAFATKMAERYSGKWIANFLLSWDAKSRGDQATRRDFLRKAINTNGDKPPFFVYQELIDLETGYFFDGKRDRLDLASELVVSYLKQTQRFDEYEPWRYLAEEFGNSNVKKVYLMKQFVSVYDSMASKMSRPRPLPAELLTMVATGRDEQNTDPQISPWLKQLRERYAARRANEPSVEADMLWFETTTDGAPQVMAMKWQKLVENSLSEKDASSYANNAVYTLANQRLECAVAQSLASGWNSRFNNNADFHRNAFEAALCSNDFSSAHQHLDAVTRLNPGQGVSDRSDRMRLALAESQATAWSDYERRNPFLKRWDQSNANGVALNIEFGTGSAVIPPRYAEALNKLARQLKEDGASDYQFDIGGHTDNRGGAALNQKLAEQRARAVVDYLVGKTGIERNRLTATGYGSAVPLAKNTSEAGMQKNRRVEITPKASLRTPQLAQQAKLEYVNDISPDGRLLATKNALWSASSRLKVRDLAAADVRQQNFLPNGRALVRLVTMTWPGISDRALEVVDTSSGLVMKRLLISNGNIEGFSISPDGHSLAMVTNGRVETYSLPALQRTGQRMLSILAGTGVITWIGNDKLAAAVRAGNEKLHLLNANTLTTLQTFGEIDYVHTLGTSRSGKYLAAITDGGKLHTWDTQTWQHKELVTGAHATRFSFHPFEEKALIDQWNGSTRKSRLIDLDKMQVVNMWDENVVGSFTPDGRSFYLGNKEYDAKTLELRKENLNQVGSNASFSAWRQDAGQFVTDEGQDSQVWDVATGRQVDRVVGLQLCGKVTGSAKLFWKCGSNHQEMIEDGSWRVIPSPSAFKIAERQFLEKETAQRLVVFERDVPPASSRVAKRGKLHIIDRASGQVLATHPVLLRQEDALYSNDDALDKGDVSTAVDPSGRYLAMRVWWKEHWGYPALSSKQVWLFDLETGKEVDRIALNKRAEKLEFALGETPRLRVGFDTYTGVYNLASKQWGKNEPWSAKETLYDQAGAMKVVGLGAILTLLDGDTPERYAFLRKEPSFVGLYPAHNLMMVYYGDGEFDYYDLKALNRQLTLHAKAKGEWLAYAPSGEFAGSLNGADGYYWFLGEKYLPFSALRERFERADVIRRQLEKVTRGSASAPTPLAATSLQQDAVTVPDTSSTTSNATSSNIASGTAQTIEADLFMPPFSLRLIDPPAKSSEQNLKLKVGVTKLRAIAAEPEIELNINGQQVKTRGLSRVSGGRDCGTSKVDCEQVIELPVNLDAGRNIVQVSLRFRNASLETKTSVIELDKPRVADQTAPRLWLFAAGVSKYADSKQNLKFADKDASELAKLLKAQEGKLFSQVNTKVLTNQEVTKGSLDTEINRFLRQATEQDLIVILLAGHGVQDNDQILYFMTHDANMEEPFSGLDVTHIRSILRSRPTNQKAILLLDICHAGALGEGRRGQVSAEDAIKQLTQGTGITVLSSSTGRELSNEGEHYRGGHGAFTAAVLEGLEGSADRDAGNRDNVVTISELTTFVMRRVPELTRNSQHPTTPSTERLQDYPVAVKP